jgi:predicted metal-dependent hydrolase
MHTITINNITIVVDRKDIKNIHLSVNPPDGNVKIASPFRVDDEAIRLFALSKLAWIKKQKNKFENQERQSAREFVLGESHYFKGKRYLLNIITTETFKPIRIKTSNKYLDLYVKKESTTEYKKNVIVEWYRKELKKEIPELLDKWQKKIGVEINGWQVRQMKNKWGSCDIENKTIRLNLEIVKKPIICLEYIIVHELVHLLERQHNDRFIELMNKYLPNWRLLRDELNRFPISHGEWDY